MIKRSEAISDLPIDYKLNIPIIVQSELIFDHSKYNNSSFTGEIEENNVKATHPGKLLKSKFKLKILNRIELNSYMLD